MFSARSIPYSQTASFSRIVTDYLENNEALRPFYAERPNLDGLRKTIENKRRQPINRQLLVETLKKQYQGTETTAAVNANIEKLLSENSFTVCTAHQPNLFTGPLYFIYKILHAIKLASYLNDTFNDNQFVPVYYMGSEDADFAELNHTFVDGKKIEWTKEQKGAVGRMKVDNTLIKLISELEGQLGVEPFGAEAIALLRNSYRPGLTIQEATFNIVNQLYGEYGLVVLIPDEPGLKATMREVFYEDLFANRPASIVNGISATLGENYPVQAHPREINLFYLKDDIRERIIREGEIFSVHNTDLSFTETEMVAELDQHPERFSPNVILRGLYQETILPNIAFVGGGGELAYWLQLKDLFDNYNITFPVLVLRNSFLVIESKWMNRIDRLGLEPEAFFKAEDQLMKELVIRVSDRPVSLQNKLNEANLLYKQIETQAAEIDPTLKQHVAAIGKRSLHLLTNLEQKMLRAEKRRFSNEQQSIHKLREALFPGNSLQERKENFSLFYARWGKEFLSALYNNSPSLEQEFTILIRSGNN